MLKPFFNVSINELNEINSHLDELFTKSLNIIPLVETDDVYPFTSCKFHIIGKKLISNGKKSRKDKEDDIRKKLKSAFLKNLKKTINKKLEKAGSKYLLESFPQKFITDITQKTNFEVMLCTFEQLLDYTYNQLIEDEKYIEREDYVKKRNAAALKKYKKNIEVLEYLNSNKKISEESGWEIIKNMKYIDLLSAYFNSNEFQHSIKKLSKKVSNEYINSYIKLASNYIDYFLSYKPNEKKSYQNKNKNSYSNLLEENEIPGLNIPLPSPFQPSILEIDNYIPEFLNYSRNDDYDLTNSNSLFTDGYLFFE